MNKILIIESDKTTGGIYQGRFRAEGFETELAEDGQTGLALYTNFQPDLVIVDVTLAGVSGVDVIRHIRAQTPGRSVPIVALTNGYIAKIVDAAWQAGANKCLVKMTSPPAQVVKVVRSLLAAAAAPVPSVAAVPDGQFVSPIAVEGDAQLQRSFLEMAPQWMATLRSLWAGFVKVEDPATRLPLLFELCRKVHALTGNAVATEAYTIARMSSGLEALLRKLYEKPQHLDESSMRTVAQGLDFLAALAAQPLSFGEDPFSTALVLVVDDEELSRRAIVGALGKAHLRAVCLGEAPAAFRMMQENQFDLLITDVDMPGMSGFDLCRQLRAQPVASKVPIIFVTHLDNLQAHAQAALSGGDDFIAKPFRSIELAVKALIHTMCSQLLPAAIRAA